MNSGHLLTVFISVVTHVRSYPGGGPDSACSSLYPSGHGTLPETSDPPYRIRLGKHSYSAGETIAVILESLGGDGYFRGVYIQARPASCDLNNTVPVGVFTYPGMDLQTRHCFDAVHSTLTHSSREKKISRKIYWTAPVLPPGHVIFRVTFVKELHTFWINVLSEILRDLKDPGEPGCHVENKTSATSPTSSAKTTSVKERHFAHVHPASTYSSTANCEYIDLYTYHMISMCLCFLSYLIH